jgi:arylsulfatase A-like enzyme
MTRLRTVLAIFLLSTAILFVGTIGVHANVPSVPATAGLTTVNPPNILVVMTDDQGKRTFVNDVMPATRSWFGDGGTNFVNAVVSTPYCCPSRASLFSGRYAHNHGVKGNAGGKFNPAGSIQDHLKAAGYTNAVYGKYLNNVTSNPPFFDSWATFPDSVTAYQGGTWNVEGSQTVVSSYATTFITSKVHDFLASTESDDSRPWFMTVVPPAPHPKWVVEDKYVSTPVPGLQVNPAMSETDTSDKPPWLPKNMKSPSGRTYQKMERTLLSVDDMITSIRSDLAALDEQSNTLAFFLSDNGYMLGEHDMGGKQKPYLQSIQVPLYMSWPGHVAGGTTDTRPAMQLDIAATIYEALGVSAETDGQSLLGQDIGSRALSENWPLKNEPQYSYASTTTAAYQYTEWYDSRGVIAFREYYDLSTDPWELNNVLTDGSPANDPDVAALSAQLAADRTCKGASCP